MYISLYIHARITPIAARFQRMQSQGVLRWNSFANSFTIYSKNGARVEASILYSLLHFHRGHMERGK